MWRAFRFRSPVPRHACGGRRWQQNTSQTLPPRTHLPIMPPQNMAGADQPMLMRRIEFHPLAIRQDARPANQRNVMEMNDIKSLRQDLPDPPAMHQGPAQLLRRQARP